MARRGGISLLRGIWRLIVLALLVVGWGLAALSLHVVVVPDRDDADDWEVVVLPKNRLGFSETYVDTRGWTLDDAQRHEKVVARLLEAGKGDLLGHVLEQSVRERMADFTQRRNALLERRE